VPAIETIAQTLVALLLAWSGGSKLLERGDRGSWLAPYGIPAAVRGPLALAIGAAEVAVAVLLAVRVEAAAYAALGLGAVFVAALAVARLRGARRLPCGCFGKTERSADVLIARALGFSGLAALAAFGAPPAPSRETALLIGLGVLAVAVLALAVLVLALYRQVGVLTLRLGPGVALELAEEGPPLGEAAPELDGLDRRGSELAVFFSADCRLCRQLAPAVRALGREGLAVRVVYEEDARDAFERWRVPGTPFAVAIVDGIAAAKGTVNDLEQLESLITLGAARAERAAA
jgi:hypothetical protein